MLGLILAVAQASAPATPAWGDPTNSTREVGALFVTFQLDQGIGDDPGLPMLGARLTGVVRRRFGLEVTASKPDALATLWELSALAVVQPKGIPVLLRAGASHLPGWDITDHSFDGADGFHVGASLLSGDVDDRVRFRIDYTYRELGHRERGVSSVGLGLVLNLAR